MLVRVCTSVYDFARAKYGAKSIKPPSTELQSLFIAK
jgi:hypothetical protein